MRNTVANMKNILTKILTNIMTNWPCSSAACSPTVVRTPRTAASRRNRARKLLRLEILTWSLGYLLFVREWQYISERWERKCSGHRRAYVQVAQLRSRVHWEEIPGRPRDLLAHRAEEGLRWLPLLLGGQTFIRQIIFYPYALAQQNQCVGQSQYKIFTYKL